MKPTVLGHIISGYNVRERHRFSALLCVFRCAQEYLVARRECRRQRIALSQESNKLRSLYSPFTPARPLRVRCTIAEPDLQEP